MFPILSTQKIIKTGENLIYLNIVIFWNFNIKVNIWKATGGLAAKLEPEALKCQQNNNLFSKMWNTKHMQRHHQEKCLSTACLMY